MALLCPRCGIRLVPAVEPTPAGRIELDYCSSCRGVWFDRHELAALLRIANRDVFSSSTPLLDDEGASIACLRERDESMHKRRFARGEETGDSIIIDQCPACEGIWLDGGELERLGAALRLPSVQRAVAGMDSSSQLTWIFLFLTGLPIEEWNPRSRWPRAVAGLEIACVIAFAWELTQIGLPHPLMERFELVPSAVIAATTPWALVSYLFLHAGVLHLAGNLYFLWLFGDNVEDRLGSGPLLAIYFTSGIAAGIVHSLLTSQPNLPIVGASGAISGVLAAYALLFPRARLVSVLFFVRIRWHARGYLAAWFALQAIGVLAGSPRVAWWAHIGGFAVGGLMASLLRVEEATPPILVPQRA